MIVFYAEDLSIMQGDEGYTKFYIDNKGEYLSSYHLGHFDKLMKKCEMFKVHRSYFIKIAKVEEYNPADETILMANKIIVPLAKTYKSKFIKELRKFLDETMILILSFGVNFLSFG